MNVLIACEFSGIVRDAFQERGHNAWSCDLLPTERTNLNHIQGNAITWIYNGWDLIIAHPPCTHLSVSGARWFKDKVHEQKQAIDFFMRFTKLDCKWAIENPVSIMSTKYRKPDQIIQPWQFGHGETKATCLWLHGLPKLIPTNIVEGRDQRVWKMPPSPERARMRSKTYEGIAKAMAEQWG